jgi:hypothetical protein
VLRWESAGVCVREDDMKILPIRDAEDVAGEKSGEDRLDEVPTLNLGLYALLEEHANSPGLLPQVGWQIAASHGRNAKHS